MASNAVTLANLHPGTNRWNRPDLEPTPAKQKPPFERKGFVPGKNPSNKAKDLAIKHTELAINTLVEVCTKSTNVMARVRAATELLDRGYGKPHLMVEQKELPPTTQVKISFGETIIEPIEQVLPTIDAEAVEAIYDDADE